jgi:hypothetical protein
MRASSSDGWLDDFLAGSVAYYLTSLPVFVAVLFGVDFPRRSSVYSTPQPDFVSACVHFDADHYVEIVREGYSYDPERRSMVAFFPAYPLLSRGIKRVTVLSAEEAALLTAHLALVVAFVLLARYVRVRWPEATTEQRNVVLAIFGLWPLGLFFRMPYAESLFLCVILLLLYGMARGWPLVVLALLAGIGTAVRPVGVALTAAFVWHVLMQPGSHLRAKVGRVLLLTPLASWGLLAYMSYQWLAFGTPWAFAQTQEHWTLHAPQERGRMMKLEALATLEPIWDVYVPSSKRYWGKVPFPCVPLFSLYFWNPILFLLAIALLAWGGWKRWLTGSELILGAALLAIPYATRAFEMSMAAHGRFAAVVVVNYVVLGRMLARSSSVIVATLCTTLALFIFMFTFLYTKNFQII